MKNFKLIIAIIILNLLLVTAYFVKNTNIKEAKKDKPINLKSLYFSDEEIEIFILNSFKTKDVTIRKNEPYDVSMFVESSFKDIRFSISNKETYTDSGVYEIEIIGKLNILTTSKKATLTILNEEVEDSINEVIPPISNIQIPIITKPKEPEKQEETPVQNNNSNLKDNQPKEEANPPQQEETKKPEPETEQPKEEIIIPPITPEPEPEPEPVPEPITGIYNDASAYQVLQFVNNVRAENNLSPLTWDSTLAENAKIRSKEASISFSHIRPNGQDFYTAITNLSYPVGENLGKGYQTPNAVFNGWMASESHKANILDPNYNKIGISMYQVNGICYWSQLFTS